MKEDDEIKKRPIVPILRDLEVGQSCKFPLEQRQSVYVLCRRYASDHIRIGWMYRMIVNKSDYTVEVKRTS
jgi:hypothetical protein